MVQETGPATFKFDGEPLYHVFGSYTRYSSKSYCTLCIRHVNTMTMDSHVEIVRIAS
jgi:hypothetical protein